ncbi:hypothetical protein PG985_016276 [Apiospora marii]|uniref:Uncharacterized protein n=1 Tax=Apiospora marii TaxID=335849 RepID=A0ABR1STY4_9PEZI
MGGGMLQPRNGDMFLIDSYQLSYLIRAKLLPMPTIDLDDIIAVKKADGLSRAVTVGRMAWFCLSYVERAILQLGISPLELETLKSGGLMTFHNPW